MTWPPEHAVEAAARQEHAHSGHTFPSGRLTSWRDLTPFQRDQFAAQARLTLAAAVAAEPVVPVRVLDAAVDRLKAAGRFLTQQRDEARRENARLREALTEARDYLDHQSWRCAHPPHYYLAGDRTGGYEGCPCGLDEFEARLVAALEADHDNPKETT